MGHRWGTKCGFRLTFEARLAGKAGATLPPCNPRRRRASPSPTTASTAQGSPLTCLDCMNHREFELETVIRRLARRGVGSAATGIKEVSGFVGESAVFEVDSHRGKWTSAPDQRRALT